MCGPKYCSMKITEEIRAMAAKRPLDSAIEGDDVDLAVARSR
jgi:hypothetical protein